VQVDIHKGEPGVVNDAEMTELILAGAKAAIGADNVLNLPGWSIADDFAYYSEKRPSVYFRLGIRNEEVGVDLSAPPRPVSRRRGRIESRRRHHGFSGDAVSVDTAGRLTAICSVSDRPAFDQHHGAEKNDRQAR
jgi:metal-dependent amidase/aminoacylase/carboxypeptidase family protein